MDTNAIENVGLVLVEYSKYKRKCESVINAVLLSDSSDSSDEELFQITSNIKNSPTRIKQFFEKIVFNYTDLEFQQNFRLTRVAFEKLLEKVAPEIVPSNTGRPQLPVEKQLLAIIWLLANPECYRSMAERFNVSKSNLSEIFFRIINALNKIASSVICWPTPTEVDNNKRKFRAMAGLTNVAGAMDGTYVPCKVPKQHQKEYTNRKKFTSITLQAICGPDLEYYNCNAGYPSSVHDSRIFRNSKIFEVIENNRNEYLPNSTVILGDKAYPVLPWCIPPYLDRGRLTNRQKRFNTAHARTRQVVERSFALFLEDGDVYNISI